MKSLAEGIRLRWEKPTARGVRYYEVDLHRDLWGEWLLTQARSRRGTRLGQVRVAACGSHAEGLARITVIGKQRRRRQRCYVGVADADPPVEKREGRRSKPTDAGAAGQRTSESARGMLGRSAWCNDFCKRQKISRRPHNRVTWTGFRVRRIISRPAAARPGVSS